MRGLGRAFELTVLEETLFSEHWVNTPSKLGEGRPGPWEEASLATGGVSALHRSPAATQPRAQPLLSGGRRASSFWGRPGRQQVRRPLRPRVQLVFWAMLQEIVLLVAKRYRATAVE